MLPLALLCLVLLSVPAEGRAAPAPARPCSGLAPENLLVRAREVFRARRQPPYVVYTIARRDTRDGLPDFEETYETRVWYRAADGAALTRRVESNAARGPLVFERPRFNAPLDPGPPTADIFERAPPRPSPQQTPAPSNGLREIGSVSTHIELDYRATLAGCDATTVHLQLQPRRDSDRNRLRELWIDQKTLGVLRFVANDRLYRGLTDIWDPDVFDGVFGREGDVPVILTIHADASTDGGEETGDYRFEAVAFPATLPAWYFEPRSYGEHRAEAPTW